jgi:membrane-associated phospholipid phosphatase
MDLIRGFYSIGPTYKMFFISTLISSMLVVYLMFNIVPEIGYSILVSSTIFILSYIFLAKYAAFPKKWKIGEVLLLILTFITVFYLPAFFINSSRVAVKKELKDDKLIKLDKLLLGWLFQDGQVSIYIDKNNFLGPHTIFGRFINNSLQIFYFFYYLIPYVTMHFINLANCGKEIIFRYQNNGLLSPTYKKNWNNTLFLFGTYLMTCFFVFLTNTLVPASSPRKYLKEKFVHPLILNGFAKFLNSKCKDDKSANSFPSGHVAEILSIGLSYLGMRNYLIGVIVIICSILIGLATLFLRYHYFCDILMAVILSCLSFVINYYFGYKKYLNSINNEKYKDINDVKVLNDSETKGHMTFTEEINNNNNKV